MLSSGRLDPGGLILDGFGAPFGIATGDAGAEAEAEAGLLVPSGAFVSGVLLPTLNASTLYRLRLLTGKGLPARLGARHVFAGRHVA